LVLEFSLDGNLRRSFSYPNATPTHLWMEHVMKLLDFDWIG
jgi:hypothetical protein